MPYRLFDANVLIEKENISCIFKWYKILNSKNKRTEVENIKLNQHTFSNELS